MAVVDVAAELTQAVAGELSRGGTAACAFVVDVSDAGATAQLAEQVESEFGGIDVLVNAAGGSLGTPRDLPDISPEDLALVLDANLKGTFFCCQTIVPRMAARGGGAIVNISSIGGRTATPVTGVPYAAAKAGVLGLTRRLAREVGPSRIRVNAVALGLFLSGPRLEGMWNEMTDAERREVLDAIPLRRMPAIEEAVEPILFLASEEAGYITGAVLDVNGGRFMAG